MKVVVSENKFNSTLSNTISDMVISQLKSREKIPDNLYGINVDAHDSKYGKMCHITYLFNDSISGYDSYTMRPIQLVVRRNIKTLFKDVFRGGFYDSLKSMNDFDKPDLIRPIRESKKLNSMKYIISERQYKFLISEQETENYENVFVNTMIGYLIPNHSKYRNNEDRINYFEETNSLQQIQDYLFDLRDGKKVDFKKFPQKTKDIFELIKSDLSKLSVESRQEFYKSGKNLKREV